MRLLDLPSELFSQVIHQLVLDVGVCDAFRYRHTCSMCLTAEVR